MAKKYKKTNIAGVTVFQKIEKDHNRPLLPPGKVYKSRTDYDRRREKAGLRRELANID